SLRQGRVRNSQPARPRRGREWRRERCESRRQLAPPVILIQSMLRALLVPPVADVANSIAQAAGRWQLWPATLSRNTAFVLQPVAHGLHFIFRSKIEQLGLARFKVAEEIRRDIRVAQFIRIERRPVLPFVDDGTF